MIELSKLKLLAQGGQAEIFDLDESKVIRVLRNKNDSVYLKTEMSVMNSLKQKGKLVPEVFEYLEIEERPSIIMEKLKGKTMLEVIRSNPFGLFKQAEKLAELHFNVTDSALDLDLISINDRAANLIPQATLLDDELKEFTLNLLAKLPKGKDICHGDFHPGNIIIADGQPYIIDWFGATSGSRLSDIAHTYLILRNTPRIPGLSVLQNFTIGLAGNILSNRYLKTCHRLQPFNWDEFSKWLVIRASERVFYGHPNEKERLIMFIKKCYKANLSDISSENWWKYI